MPRAFLITRRRYDGTEHFEETMRDCSPERGVSVAEYSSGQPTSDGVSDCGSETSSECPEELYNLTKLAEVSLAAAAGTLIHPGNNVMYERAASRYEAENFENYESARGSSYELNESFEKRASNENALQERTRLFFERIEAERKILERRSPGIENENQRVLRLPTREPSPQATHATRHRYHHRAHHHPEPRKLPAEVSTTTTTTTSLEPTQTPKKSGGQTTNAAETPKIDDTEDHECPDCGKRYSTSSNLARHRQTHRSLGDKKARRCPHCDKVYVSMPAFSMHVRTHNQGCKCHYCGKCFSRPWLLQGHIRTHTGEKPFKCTICNKAFADKSNLRAHIQTHSNTKPHVCGRCGKAFALKSYLYKHEESSCMRAHHRASSEKRETERSSPLPRRISMPVTASPTSVIVPRLGLGRSVSVGATSEPFSAIRHTKLPEQPARMTNDAAIGSTTDDKYPKRRLSENTSDRVAMPENEEQQPSKRRSDIPAPEVSEYRSQMVIRTSVISPNPEHLGRLTTSAVKNKPFEFATSRASAFSRPGMTLNLAIA